MRRRECCRGKGRHWDDQKWHFCLPCLSTLSSTSDPMWCETLKSFNYQQLLGIHWMHEDQKGKKRVRIRMSREEWKRERVFDALVHSSADKTEQHFDCCSKGAHHLERSSVAVLWMGSSAFVWPQSKNMALWWCSPPAPLPSPSLSLHLAAVRLAL